MTTKQSTGDHAYNVHTGTCDWCGMPRNQCISAPTCYQSPKMLAAMRKMSPDAHDPINGVPDHLTKMAKLFRERNSIYGSNYRMVGELMAVLFPEGATLKTEAEHNKFHLFMLAIVKLSRYAVNYQEGHADSLDDMIVYLSMVHELDRAALEAKTAEDASAS